MNGYICFYQGRKCEVTSTSSYDAQRQAAVILRVKDNKRYLIEVCLCEKSGVQVLTDPASLPGA